MGYDELTRNGTQPVECLSFGPSSARDRMIGRMNDGSVRFGYQFDRPGGFDSLVWAADGSILIRNLSNILNVKGFGAIGNGIADDSAAIQSAINAVPALGGRVVFPPGTYLLGSTLNLDNKTAVTLQGSSNAELTDNNLSATLRYTGAAGSLLTGHGSRNLRLVDLALQYSHAAYNDILIDLSQGVTGLVNTSFAIIERCQLTGITTSSLNALALVLLDRTHHTTIRDTLLQGSSVGIQGPTVSFIRCNQTEISNCWFQAPISTACCRLGGQNLTIRNNTFESAPGDPAVLQILALSVDLHGFTIQDNWTGDGPVTGTHIDLSAFPALAGQIRSNTFSNGAIDVDFGGSCADIEMKSNFMNPGTTVCTATAWQHLQVSGNNTSSGLGGVTVADNANIPITVATAGQGRGIIFIHCITDSTTAIYSLNGGAGNTTEISDPSGQYTNAVGGAGTTNIYWDAGTTTYRLENKRGAPKAYRIDYTF